MQHSTQPEQLPVIEMLVPIRDSKGNVHTINPSRFSGVCSSALRNSVGLLIGEELQPEQSFTGMIYSNEHHQAFIIEGTPVPMQATRPPISAKILNNNGTTVADVHDRQFLVRVHGTVRSITEKTGKRLLEIEVQKHDTENQ